jgi:hypothetical protein
VQNVDWKTLTKTLMGGYQVDLRETSHEDVNKIKLT